MRSLTRYTTIAFLRLFLVSLTAITVFSLVIVVAAQAIREGLGPGPVLRMMPYILPVTMRYSVPAAALLAGCMLFGRMSSDNEIVAIKSMGISPISVLSPIFVVAFLISVATVWINDIAVSWGRPGAQRIITESIEQIAYGMLSSRRSFELDPFSIVVKEVDGRRLVMPVIRIRDEEKEEVTTISAREAWLRYLPEAHELEVVFKDGMVEASDFESRFIGEFPQRIQLPDSRADKNGEKSPSDYAIRELPAQRARTAERISHLEGLMAADAAFCLVSGDERGLQNSRWDSRVKALRVSKYRINRLRTEPWRRWANGFSCFFFVVVGVPLSIRMRNSDFMTSFFSTFLPILVVYYPLMTFGVDRAKDGDLPQFACWLGNVACGCWAVWLLRRVLRY